MPFIIGLICVLLAPFVLLLTAPVNLLRHLHNKGKENDDENKG